MQLGTSESIPVWRCIIGIFDQQHHQGTCSRSTWEDRKQGGAENKGGQTYIINRHAHWVFPGLTTMVVVVTSLSVGMCVNVKYKMIKIAPRKMRITESLWDGGRDLPFQGRNKGFYILLLGLNTLALVVKCTAKELKVFRVVQKGSLEECM